MDVLYEDKYSVLIVLQEYSLMAIWQGSPLLVTTGIVCYIVFADIHDINNAYSRNVSSWFPLLSAQRLLLIMMRVRSPVQVPGPGLERWDLMSAGRADRPVAVTSGLQKLSHLLLAV